jgi:hypothetical protein
MLNLSVILLMIGGGGYIVKYSALRKNKNSVNFLIISYF